jgi:16S rRNA (guanine966-N2)-methyltransferase
LPMRVIAGQCKGRQLSAVPGRSTRPTADRVKESLFSMIGPFFDGGIVLDLFAGTGALGIEALSRGCEKAYFVDHDRRAVETIRRNITSCHFRDAASIYCMDARKALALFAKTGAVFDYVFLDPPYRMRIIEDMIEMLVERGLLSRGAVIAAETRSDYDIAASVGPFRLRRHSRYGDTSLAIFAEEMETE